MASLHNSMYIRTLYSQNINDFQSKHLMKMVDKMDVNNGMYSTFIEENSIFMEKFFTFMEDHKKSFVRTGLHKLCDVLIS